MVQEHVLGVRLFWGTFEGSWLASLQSKDSASVEVLGHLVVN